MLKLKALLVAVVVALVGLAAPLQETKALTNGQRSLLFSKPKASFLLFDQFSRYANATVMNGQIPLIGPTWSTTGTGVPTISSGFLVQGAGGVGYLYTNMPSTPQTLGVTLSFSGGADLTQQNVGMAWSNQTPPTLSIKSLVHHNFGPTSFTVGVFDASGVFTALMQGNWLVAMNNTGTVYNTYAGVINNTAIVVGPSGETFAVTDPTIGANYGPMIFYEPLTETDGLTAQFSTVYAINNKVVLPGFTTFSPAFATSDITLSNGNLTATSAAVTSAPQVLSVAARTNGKVYFEVKVNNNANPTVADFAIGIASFVDHTLSTDLGGDLKSVGVWSRTGAGQSYVQVAGVQHNIGTGFGFNNGDVIGVAVDFGTGGGLYWAKNITQGTGWNNDILANQNPATGTGGFSGWNSGAPFGIAVEMQDNTDQCTLNTGGSAYVGTPPSGFVNWLFLLNRDIDPAANDNEPAWLEKVA